MKINIEYNTNIYEIDSDKGINISIPVEFNKDDNPKFYDTSNPKKNYYKSNGIEYNIDEGAGCSVPLVTMNIHCSGTHTETANHIIKNAPIISDFENLNFIPTQLISITPESNSNEAYHADINQDDKVITKDQLLKSLAAVDEFLDAVIIRTLPNDMKKKTRNYNSDNHPFLSNEAVYFLKSKGVKHILVDIPSIDKFDDGGKLKNHNIFFTNEDGVVNKNTITELVYIPDHCLDGKYLLCIGVPNFKLDAAPSKPIIYKIK